MRETNIIKVGDTNYEFYHVPAETAIEISVKLTKIISPLVAGGMDMQVTALIPLLKDALDPTELKWLIREILDHTKEEKSGKYVSLDMSSFNGRIGRLYTVVAQGLIYNFDDFFDEIRPFAENIGKQFQARMKK